MVRISVHGSLGVKSFGHVPLFSEEITTIQNPLDHNQPMPSPSKMALRIPPAKCTQGSIQMASRNPPAKGTHGNNDGTRAKHIH